MDFAGPLGAVGYPRDTEWVVTSSTTFDMSYAFTVPTVKTTTHSMVAIRVMVPIGPPPSVVRRGRQ